MVKAYLRYDLASTFGVVASNSNVVYDHSGKLIITASLENITIWNVKQGTLVCMLSNISSCPCTVVLIVSWKDKPEVLNSCYSCPRSRLSLLPPALAGRQQKSHRLQLAAAILTKLLLDMLMARYASDSSQKSQHQKCSTLLLQTSAL